MKVLSLDIDFFVSPIAYSKPLESFERLPEKSYKVDSEEEVRRFLEEKCLLSTSERIDGAFIQNHDEAFAILKKFEDNPPYLTHVDAHADLGLGDSGYRYLLGEWLHDQPLSLPKPGPNGMNLSNWLAFAAAARLVTGIEFVPHTMDETSDVFSFYQSSNPKELAFFDISPEILNEYILMHRKLEDLKSHPVKVSVPWLRTDRSLFQLEVAPNFVIVCQSPQFTPKAADRLFDEVLREYVVG